MKIEPWMVRDANAGLRHEFSIDKDTPSRIKAVLAEREAVQEVVDLNYNFLVMFAAQREIPIASPDKDMGYRIDEQMFYARLRNFAMCNEFGYVSSEGITTVYLAKGSLINRNSPSSRKV